MATRRTKRFTLSYHQAVRTALSGPCCLFRFVFLGSLTVGLFSPVQRAVVGRDDDLSEVKIELEIDVITRI